MKIGFAILSHKPIDDQYLDLLEFLSCFPSKYIVIHHDFSKSPFDIDFVESKFQDTHVLREIISTGWSHVNNIYALLNLFKKTLEQKCDWVVTLSANCYPNKSIGKIQYFFNHAPYDLYLEHYSVLDDNFDFYKYFKEALFKKKWFSVPYVNRKFQLKRKIFRRKLTNGPFNHSFVPYHGSDWFFANNKSIQYLFTELDRIFLICNFLNKVNLESGYTICPPEVVFHSVWVNSNIFSILNNNFRYINWEGSTDWHPNTLDESYWNQIYNSEALFLRKLDVEKSKKLRDLIKNNIKNN